MRSVTVWILLALLAYDNPSTAAFLHTILLTQNHQRQHNNCSCQTHRTTLHRIHRLRNMISSPTMAAKTSTTDSDTEQTSAAPGAGHIISSILSDSISSIEDVSKEYHVSQTIHQAVCCLEQLRSHANSFTVDHQSAVGDENSGKDLHSASTHNIDANKEQHPELVQQLASTAITSIKSLQSLIARVNNSRKRSKKFSVHAWKSLESTVNSVLDSDPSQEVAHTLAILSMGIVLSIDSTDATITKMIASAILPNDKNRGEKKYQKLEGDKAVVSDDMISEEEGRKIKHVLARAVLLRLLYEFVNSAKESAQSKDSGCTGVKRCIDLQIVAKMESSFDVGRLGRTLSSKTENDEAAKVVADVVQCIFGSEGAAAPKDSVTPMLSLVANTRPWVSYPNEIDVKELVTVASEMDLWYSAELLVDAAIDSIVSSSTTSASVMLATSFPHGAETESLLSNEVTTASLPEDSIAHQAAGAIIDIAFDNRLYRRADIFASKYYSFGGPERYAEARFLHACDTITKLVKKRQVQIIDKQIERVDEMVARVSKDLDLTPPTSEENETERRALHGDDVPIETMSEHIRQFTLRRLRATNMHAAAARLAKLWDMEYSHDPLLMQQEIEKRKLTYLQWDDEGCPGSNSNDEGKEPLPLPDLISDPEELLKEFRLIEENVERTVGFDCEWHDSINFVALLQLSSVEHSLLLDIPVLSSTKEGCDALKATVGRLFSRSTNVRHVVGFGCKDDIKRLRASPCVTSSHWFPQDEKSLYFEDLRHLIAEVSPAQSSSEGNRLGLHHFGLSRVCEAFIGKQLDKAEQCSDWLARPLSLEQREYAALDAWACAAIHFKITEGLKKE